MDFLFDSKWNAHILIDQKKKYVDGMYNNEMIKTRERERKRDNHSSIHDRFE